MKAHIVLLAAFATGVSVLYVCAGEVAPPKYRLTVRSSHLGELGLVEMDADGTGAVLLAVGSINSPAWSPDGIRVAYWSGPTGSEQIYTMNADGTDERKLTDNARRNLNPAWSPNGSEIAFVSQLGPEVDDRTIFVMDADGGNPLNLSGDPRGDDGWDDWPAWTPDGGRILFTSARQDSLRLRIMAADGSARRNLFDWPIPPWSGAAPSPDGALIAYAAWAANGTHQLFVATASGRSARQITMTGQRNEFPSWSPDGRYIAYVHYQIWSRDDPETKGDLMVYDAFDETHARLLTGVLDQYDGSRPAWRPVPTGYDK